MALGFASWRRGDDIGYIFWLVSWQAKRQTTGHSSFEIYGAYRVRNEGSFYREKDGELESIRFDVNLVFYNPSDKIKVVRNLRVEFYNDKRQLLFSCSLRDWARAKNVNGLNIPEDVLAMNVGPGYAELFKGDYFLNHDNLQKKDEIDKCFLAYDDEKMKKRLANFQSFDFKSIALIKAKEAKK
jgi:hypothetical protein